RAAEEAARQPRGNAKARVNALMLSATLRVDHQDGRERAAAQLLAESGRLLPAGDPLSWSVQEFVGERIWDSMLSAAQQDVQAGLPIERAEGRLRADLPRF